MRDQIRNFEKENSVTFSNRKKMIQFVSKYLAIQYRLFLKMECAMEMDSEEEQCYWEDKLFSCVSKFENALKAILSIKLMLNKSFEINSESNILKIAFKYAGETVSPKACFAKNVKYEIKDLTFEKIFY